jgi:hypothetical protein
VPPVSGDVHISVDTLSDKTTFDPWIVVTDASTCYMGEANDSFACSYPPAKGECPGYDVPVTAGDAYAVVVRSNGSCASTIGEYSITVDTSSDPSLGLKGDDSEVIEEVYVHVEGTANVP